MSQEKLIEMGKKYRTRNGKDVRIIAVDRVDQEYPVVALVSEKDSAIKTLNSYTKFGRFNALIRKEHDLDLVEVSPWGEFKLDDKVIVWNNDNPNYRHKRYFAGVDDEGRPTVWKYGTSSWTCEDRSTTSWDNCVRAEDATELQSVNETNEQRQNMNTVDKVFTIPKLNRNYENLEQCEKFSCAGLSCKHCAVYYRLPNSIDTIVAESIRLHGATTNE